MYCFIALLLFVYTWILTFYTACLFAYIYIFPREVAWLGKWSIVSSSEQIKVVMSSSQAPVSGGPWGHATDKGVTSGERRRHDRGGGEGRRRQRGQDACRVYCDDH